MKNSEIKNQALEALQGKWCGAVLVTFIYFAIVQCINMPIQIAAFCNPALSLFKAFPFVVSVFIIIPMLYGFSMYFLNLCRSNEVNVSMLFDGFKDYARVFGTLLLTNVYTLLWMMLLIIPGIIKSLSYALTPFIMVDNPEIKNNEAIELSMKMMDGYKMKLFLLQLGFIGWMILSILTLGIGLLWLIPYIQTSTAAFYEDVKNGAELN